MHSSARSTCSSCFLNKVNLKDEPKQTRQIPFWHTANMVFNKSMSVLGKMTGLAGVLWLAGYFLLVHHVLARRAQGQYWTCNSIENGERISLRPFPSVYGLIRIIFCTQIQACSNTFATSTSLTRRLRTLLTDRRVTNAEAVSCNTMSNNGTEFDFAKSYDALQLYTNWNIIFC